MTDQLEFIDFSFLDRSQPTGQEYPLNDIPGQETLSTQATSELQMETATPTINDFSKTSNPVGFGDLDSGTTNLPTTQVQTNSSQTESADDPMALYPPRTVAFPEGSQLYPFRTRTQVTDRLSENQIVKDITIVSPTTLEVDGVQFASLGRMCKTLNSTNWMLQKCYLQIQIQKNRIDSLERHIKHMMDDLKTTNALYASFIRVGEEQLGLYLK